MAPESAPAPPGEHLLALREGGERRRNRERRTRSRGRPDRRQSQRRRQLLGRALLTSLTICLPILTKTAVLLPPPSPLSRSAAKQTIVIPFPGVVAVAATPLGPYDDLIIEAATTYDLDPRLLRSVVQVESAFDHMAVSRAGAKGLMQLKPKLARELRVHDPFDPQQNIMGGALYLRRLLDMHDGDVRLALASYNAGPRNVTRYGGVPPFQETQKYVRQIIDLWEQSPDI